MIRQKTIFRLPAKVLALSVVLLACKRDTFRETEYRFNKAIVFRKDAKDEAHGNSAAAHINASEKLDVPSAVALPQNLPNGNSRVATYYAVGVQRYRASQVAGRPGHYEWVFVAPQAELFDVFNKKVGTHGAGPHWQLSPADSIFGQQFSPARSLPAPDAESIDWLLLKPQEGRVPTGRFADVDYIQRIATQGGKPPATAPTAANQTVEVNYKAVYRFSKINP